MKVPQVEEVAHTQYHLKLRLDGVLKQISFTPNDKQILGNHENYFIFWQSSFGDKFFDMGTFVRLGTAIETGMKDYYISKKGYANLSQLRTDPLYSQNIFQRVQTKSQSGAIQIYWQGIAYDLTTNQDFKLIQEIMLHRHLYAHNSGLLDDKYINDLKALTGQDILLHPEVVGKYPNEDIYWFEPLRRLQDFIEGTRSFFRNFPV